MNEPPVEVPNALTPEEAEKEQMVAFQERFDNMVQDLIVTRRWSKRKATRYLESKARQANKKFLKEGRKRQQKLREEGKLVDTADLSAKLDAEFEQELEAAGLTKADLDPMVPAEDWPHEPAEGYKPPTSDF